MDKAIYAHFWKKMRFNVQSPQQKVFLLLFMMLALISSILYAIILYH